MAERLLRFVYARPDWDALLEGDRAALAAPADGVLVRWRVARTAVTSEPLPAGSDRLGALGWVAIDLYDGRLVAPLLVDASEQQCRVCGCLDHLACEGGCAWVAADLCSACATDAPEVTHG